MYPHQPPNPTTLMYNIHSENYSELSHPRYFPLVDYTTIGDATETYLYGVAIDDVLDIQYHLADIAREFQLVLDLTGNLDAPLN